MRLSSTFIAGLLFAATATNTLAIAQAAPQPALCADQASGEAAACDAVKSAPAKKPSAAFTAGRFASLARMRQCAVEWKTAKADEAIKAAGWPHYWSGCNKRLKAAAAQ